MPFPCCLDAEEKIRPIPDVNCSREAKDLLSRFLEPDPTQRLRSLIALKREDFLMNFPIAAAVNMTVNMAANMASEESQIIDF